MVQLCFNAFNGSRYLGAGIDLPTQISAAAAAGFPYFGPDLYSLDAWMDDGHSLAALADHLVANGMRCWELAAGLALGSRAESIAAARHAAKIAAVLRPAWVQIYAGAPTDRETPAILAEVCDVLAPTGARIAIEYMPFSPLASILDTYRLVEDVGFDRARVLIDTWHHFRGADSDADLQTVPLEAIAYIQFDDALPIISDDLQDETVNRRTFPGDGEFDLNGFCAGMKNKGFDGMVSVEIINAEWRERDIFEFAKRAFVSTVRFWQSAKGQGARP